MDDDTDHVPDGDDPWYRITRRIQLRRLELGLSTKDVAERLGTTSRTIRNWEFGKGLKAEKLRGLAEALDLDVDELLDLHPEVARAKWTPAEWHLTTRHVVAGLSILVILVAIVGALSWMASDVSCFEAGTGGGSMAEPFTDAYREFGGEAVLGCATNEVHKWGPGFVQDYDGGSTDRGILMTLDQREVFVLAGNLWEDYVGIAGGATADLLGYPVSVPRRCGDGVLVEFRGGEQGIGALVSVADGSGFAWLAADTWAFYRSRGGPQGALGLPVDRRSVATPDGFTHGFERGTIEHRYGVGTSSDVGSVRGGGPLDLGSCAPYDIVDAALLSDRPD